MRDYLIVEAGDGPGGTWYWNTYPGIAVDIPSFSYQFSFEQSPDWSRTYAPGNELKAYAERCVDKYGLRPRIRFDTKVLGADFDDDTRRVARSYGIRGRRRHGDRAIPRQRQRCADHAQPSRHRRRRLVRRRDDAHRALGPRPGPHRQARRDHRDRRVRRPGDPRDRADGRAPDRLPAHADLVLPEVRRAAVDRRARDDAVAAAARPCSACSARPTSS